MTVQDHEAFGRGLEEEAFEQVSVIDETSIEQAEVAGLSQGQIVRRRFVRHKGAMIAIFFLTLIVVLAATSIGWGPIPGWWKYSYTDLVPSVPDGADGPTLSLRPTWLGGAGIGLGEHPFGLDNELGKDMFAMTMRGVQTTLAVIIVLGILSTTIGVVVGVAVWLLRQVDGRRHDAVHGHHHRHPAAPHHGRRRLRPRVAGHVAGGPGPRPVPVDRSRPAGPRRVPRPARA